MKEAYTEVQLRCMEEDAVENKQRISELQASIENKNKYFTVLMFYAVIVTALIFAFAIQRDTYRDGTIKRGYMIYNPTNSQLQWVEGLTSTNK